MKVNKKAPEHGLVKFRFKVVYSEEQSVFFEELPTSFAIILQVLVGYETKLSPAFGGPLF